MIRNKSHKIFFCSRLKFWPCVRGDINRNLFTSARRGAKYSDVHLSVGYRLQWLEACWSLRRYKIHQQCIITLSARSQKKETIRSLLLVQIMTSVSITTSTPWDKSSVWQTDRLRAVCVKVLFADTGMTQNKRQSLHQFYCDICDHLDHR